MVLLALSFQGQVEKYGVYVGVAAFFGLAVLSLLYFSQARELKRLREWAGRAPERARELEERVVAEAEAAAAARPAPASPVKAGIAPPRRLAEMPAAAAGAQTAAGVQSTGVAEAVQDDAAGTPATNGNVPAAPAAAAAAPPGTGNGPAPPAEDVDDAVEPTEQAGGDEEPEVATSAGDATAQQAGGAALAEGEAPAAIAAGDVDADTAPGAAGSNAAAVIASGAGSAPVEAGGAAGGAAEVGDQAAAQGAAEAGGQAPATGDDAPAPRPSGGDADAPRLGGAESTEAERPAPASPGEVSAPVPRVTPAQRVGVTPRPAPMPLRQSQPSAAAPPRPAPRAAPGQPARRPAAAPPRQGRSAGTIALFVGLAVLILGGGTFLVSQLAGEDTPPPPNRAAPAPGDPDVGADDAGGAATPAAETNVAVLNGTTFAGLAGQLADRISREGGYERGATETNTRDQTLQSSTVFYADGFRSQARKVAGLLSISAVEPIDEDTGSLAPDADVVVLAGADRAP